MRNENFKFFMKQVKSLEINHKGEFALVHKKKIVGFFSNHSEAYKYAEEMYEDGTFLIQPCSYEANFAKLRHING